MATQEMHVDYLNRCLPAADPGEAEPARLASNRREAREAFLAQGLPGRSLENWKYSPLRLIGESPPRAATAAAAVDPSPWSIRGLAEYRFVCVDGRYRPELSSVDDLPVGLDVADLAAALARDEAGTAGFATLTPAAEQPLVALNGAAWRGGLSVRIAPGTRLVRPLRLLNIATGGAAQTRALIQIGAEASARIVEHSVVAPGAEAPFANGVTELFCGEGSWVDHIKIQQGGEGGRHIGHAAARLAAGCRFRSREISWDGRYTRRESVFDCAGEGVELDHALLYLGAAGQVRDMRSRIEHSVPGCESRTLAKGILAGDARGIFDGQIRVARGADRTQAYQTNRNLLLDDAAVANSIPRLEIYADDVKCSHGSTTGRLPAEQIFYLRTRGLALPDARAMLIAAFAREVVQDIEPATLRGCLEGELTRRLPAADGRARG